MFHVKPQTHHCLALAGWGLFVLLISLVSPLSLVPAQAPVQPVFAQSATPEALLETKAREMVNSLAQEHYQQASQYFDSQMLSALPLEKFKETWSAINTQMGAYETIQEITQNQQGEYQVVYVTTQFEKGLVDIKIVFNSTGQVSGLFFVPAGTGKNVSQDYTSPAYVDFESFREKEVVVTNGDWALPGTLSMPKGTGLFPALILVHGSGPNDRDETLGPNKPFRDLAQGLASQGIAVLRYDKRTQAYPLEMADLVEQITVQEEVIDDALAAIDLLRHTEQVDPGQIYLLGHSLGGMLAPQIASQAPDLAGVIILAGPTRPLEDIVVDQITYLANLDGTLSSEEQAQIDTLTQQAAQMKNLDLTNTDSSLELLGAPASYWLSLRESDPVQTARELDMPLFIAQGERDYQVTAADFNGWQSALGDQPDVYLKQYPHLNHLFMQGRGTPSPQEYQQAGNVSEILINDIGDFIKTGSVDERVLLIGGRLNSQDIVRLILLLLPILLIQLGVSIYALLDISKKKKVRGPRWLWVILLVITLLTLPTGLIVATVYLVWGRKDETDDDPS